MRDLFLHDPFNALWQARPLSRGLQRRRVLRIEPNARNRIWCTSSFISHPETVIIADPAAITSIN
jgi:hypothetical protein